MKAPICLQAKKRLRT